MGPARSACSGPQKNSSPSANADRGFARTSSYWNLRESPFLNVDNEALLYPSPQLQEGVARLYYLIDQERTAGMVTGPYGVGKTYLLSCLVRRSKSLNLPLIRFDAIPDGSLPMARHILQRLDIKGDTPTLADALMLMRTRCIETDRRPLSRHILLIDEAQYLTEKDGLYLVHFLCNLTVESGKGHQKNLFTTILAGTPQLAEFAGKAYYFHIKDASGKKVVPAGCGDAKIDELIKGIDSDTVFSVEPHLMFFKGGAGFEKYDLKTKSGRFDCAVDSIKKLLVKNGFAEKDGYFEKIKGE